MKPHSCSFISYFRPILFLSPVCRHITCEIWLSLLTVYMQFVRAFTCSWNPWKLRLKTGVMNVLSLMPEYLPSRVIVDPLCVACTYIMTVTLNAFCAAPYAPSFQSIIAVPIVNAACCARTFTLLTEVEFDNEYSNWQHNHDSSCNVDKWIRPVELWCQMI